MKSRCSQSVPTTVKAKDDIQKKELVARIRVMAATTELKVKFNKKYGVIKVIFGVPFVTDIIEWL